MKKIKIIGLGGIGGYIIDPLFRYLSITKEKYEVTLIDGDSFEEKNKDRQRFESFENKAAHTANLAMLQFSALCIRHKAEFVTKNNIISLIRENDVVFLCVDNHATRKLVSERCEALNNVVLISGGNDYTDGNVIVYIRKDGVNVSKSPTELYPAIANPQDENPGEVLTQSNGCEQQVDEFPQLVITNFAIASSMLNCYYAMTMDKVNFEQVYIDILANKMRPAPTN